MNSMQRFGGAAATPGILLCATVVMGASAQTYPDRPVRLIVPTAPGASVDFIARLTGHHLTKALGQQVVVDNRAGANQLIGTQIVARSAPDGYTILTTSTPFVTQPLLMTPPPYSPVKDFVPITLAAESPNILTVTQSLPVKSVSDLISYARARPGQLNYATGSAGASPHLAAELFKVMAKVDMVRIGYKGAGPAIIDLIAERCQLMFATAVSVLPHIRSGKLRALAVTTIRPSSLVPDLPTIAASGLPRYESSVSLGFVLPAGTASAIAARLNKEIVKIIQDADVKRAMLAEGVDAVASTPAEFAAFIKAETETWGALFKQINLRVD